MGHPKLWLVVICSAMIIGALVADTALASFPGENGDIAVVSLRDPSNGSQDLDAISPTGRHRMRLTDSPEDDSFPAYSGDGERIVFSRSPVGEPNSGQIWIMNADGSGQRQLTPGPPATADHDPVLSPNGKLIVFTRITGSAEQLWIMRADGSDQHEVTFPGQSGEHAHGASFSPDGRYVAFSHFDPATGYHDVSVISVDGTGERALTAASASHDAYQPDFAPNGKRVVFDFYDQSQDDLWVVNLDGSGLSQLTSGADDLDLSPAFSPDGSRVAFERDAPGFTVANIFTASSTGLDQGVTGLTSNVAPAQTFQPAWQALNPPACKLAGTSTSTSSKRVEIKVSCQNENALAIVKGYARKPRLRLPTVRTKVAAHESKRAVLTIPGRYRAALEDALDRGRRPKVKITARFKDDLGQASKDSLGVRLR
jgi:Tol biopolymer transport system component